MLPDATREWLIQLGFRVADEAMWLEALTHGSAAAGRTYERLEFLGDRVLGLAIAEWLYQLSDAAEGTLTQRYHVLVSRQTCAAVARACGAGEHLQLGRQARDHGAHDSDNVLGDVMEALIGACFLEDGYEAARAIVHKFWRSHVESPAGTVKHPKSALQEWAAGNNRKAPEYRLVERSGPDHAARFTVAVSIKGVGEAQATAASKQEAETAAAAEFMRRFA